MTGKYIVRNERIGFRPATEDDIPHIIEMEKDDANSPYIRCWTREKHLAAIEDTNIAQVMVETVDTHTIVGFVILIGLKDADRNLEFKRIAIKDKGRGYGRDAVQLIKKFAFEKAGVHRLWLEVIEYNDRARQLYESEGFVFEGTHRKSMKVGDKYFSLHVMSILEGEY